MARAPKKKRKRKKKPRRFRSASQIQANLSSITKQQKRYKKAKRRFKRGKQPRGFAPEIIESIEKSERAWENELRKITKPEDLDAFE